MRNMKTNTKTLTPELLHQMDAYWRAANYVSVGQIYLFDNPLLRRPLALGDIKHMLLGHWGTTLGQNFIYVHLNRVIKKYDLDMIYVSGPGHGGPAVVGNTYLEGTYSEIYPNISQDEAGLRKLFIQFSFPGGIPSHASPECPGSIHEGGELGYSLSHSFGAVFDNPDLIVACCVGDGEAETGPLATSWQSNKFLDPVTDGAVLPILHLNGYKIANPTILARIEPEELDQLHRGNGWKPYSVEAHELGLFLRDVAKFNREQRNFRIFGPDETLSNRLTAVFEVTNRQWDARTQDNDEFLALDGRVMEMLSEHQCEGWLEGYLLTGRHGLFNSYEAFIHIVDSMFNQHAKWLKVTATLPWRRKIASLNYLLASHVWQQMHNGLTHQDPGFIDHVVNKKASVVRVYLAPDANCLLSVWDHCLRRRTYVNVVIAGKYQAPQWLSMDAAIKHCTKGIGKWQWASNDEGTEPDLVMACCGDVPTLETLAAVSILREHLPDLKVRVVNVVDLMK